MSTENSLRDNLAVTLGSDYDIVRELGRGGASVVYLARDRVLGREVAIKVIRDSQAGDAEAIARFKREARTLAALQHPNIVMLYGAKQLPGGTLALVMQHGEWTTLKGVIREHGPLPIEAVQQVLRDLASALVYLHRHQIIHRDIKPENIFIEADSGRALLSDFGIAKSGDARTSVTLAGVVIGTPAYMSPEQIDGGDLTGRSDLYSLGMVGYEMLTGIRPWDGENLFSVIYKQKTEKLPPLLQQRPDTPDSLRRLIEKATEKAPAARWGSAEEFLGALSNSSIAAVAAPPSWAEIPTPAKVGSSPATEYPTLEIEQAIVDQAFTNGERIRRRKQRFMAAAVVALLLSGGAGALAFAGGREPGAELDGSYMAAAAEAAVYGAGEEYAAAAPVATDTLTSDLAEPIDASPPPAEPPRNSDDQQNATTNRVRPGTSENRPAARPEPAEQESQEDETPAAADFVAPPNLLPELSVTRPVGNGPRPVASQVLESRTGPRTAAPAAAPQLRNRDRIGELLAERYPTDLRTRGIGGTTMLTVLVAPDGTVEQSTVVTSSGNTRLDEAARSVARRMVFNHPEGAARQAVWVAVPLTFTPR